MRVGCPPALLPFFFSSPAAGKKLVAMGEWPSKAGGARETLGTEQEGDRRGRLPVCEETSFPALDPIVLCFSVILPAWRGAGLFVCVVWV